MRALTCVAALLMVFASPAHAQSSANYSMTRVTMVSGAGSMVSINFSSSVVGPQVSVSGAASVCNTGRETSMGFWSVLGQMSVPIVLVARRSPSDPLEVELSWSGAERGYQLYRAFTPVDLLNPANLELETPQCGATDSLAFQSNLIFYQVVPSP